MDPILHLSIAVRALADSVPFYVDVLGCTLGRVRDAYVDVWFYGLQLTLHEQPQFVLGADERGPLHFGVTLDLDELDNVVARLTDADVDWVSPFQIDHAGTDIEQRKCKVADPSGNVIEIKGYVDPATAFENLGLRPIR